MKASLIQDFANYLPKSLQEKPQRLNQFLVLEVQHVNVDVHNALVILIWIPEKVPWWCTIRLILWFPLICLLPITVLSSLSSALWKNSATSDSSVPTRPCDCRNAKPFLGFLLNSSMPCSKISFCCFKFWICSMLSFTTRSVLLLDFFNFSSLLWSELRFDCNIKL